MHTERPACSLFPVLASEMALSVEPVMLTRAPLEPTQEEPQPSTSTSHLCIKKPSFKAPVSSASSALGMLVFFFID